jgi:hypothetical protein
MVCQAAAAVCLWADDFVDHLYQEGFCTDQRAISVWTGLASVSADAFNLESEIPHRSVKGKSRPIGEKLKILRMFFGPQYPGIVVRSGFRGEAKFLLDNPSLNMHQNQLRKWDVQCQ